VSQYPHWRGGGVAFAQSASCSNSGPYPFGLTEPEIEAVTLNLLQHEEPNLTQVPADVLAYMKWQFSGGSMQCWKYPGLCELYGQQKAGQFLAEYITMIRKLPNAADYAVMTDSLLDEYDDYAETATPYALPAGASGYYAQCMGIYAPGQVWDPAVTEDPDSTDGVTLHLGRARYFIGGHNWARGTAVPQNGEDVCMDAVFYTQLPGGNGRAKEKSVTNACREDRKVITGKMGGPRLYLVSFRTDGAAARAHGDEAEGEACWEAVINGTSANGNLVNCNGAVYY